MEVNNSDLTDLLANESFINYCRQSSPADIAFWENYILQHPEHQEMIETARENFLLLFNGLAEADLREQEGRLKSRLHGMAPIINIDDHAARTQRRPLLLRRGFAVAASILLLAGFYGIYLFATKKEKALKTFLTNYGERKNIQLPDGSAVNLNAGSKIVIDESFDQSSRDVYLSGEAFFDVKHNDQKPFIVHTAEMDVKAVGTAFDIKAYNEEKLTQTSLIRGIIEVTLKKNNDKVVLYPNQKITWSDIAAGPAPGALPAKKTGSTDPETIRTEKIKVTEQGDIKEIAWKDNKLVFDNDSLNEIAHMLERWYGLHIQFKDEAIKAYRFTGIFEREDLPTVLNFLKESKHFNFNIDNGENLTVYLSR